MLLFVACTYWQPATLTNFDHCSLFIVH